MHFYPPLGFPADRLSHWSRVTPVERVSSVRFRLSFGTVTSLGHVIETTTVQLLTLFQASTKPCSLLPRGDRPLGV